MGNKRQHAGKKRSKPIKLRPPVTSQQKARFQQAIHAHSVGQLAAAEAGYRALIADKIRTPELFCRLALICAQSERRDEADSLWKKALAIDPGFLEAQMNLADSYQLAGDLDRAVRTYRKILAEHEYFHIAKYMLANMLKSQGKMAEASELYRQIMAQQPDYTQAHFNFSGIHKYRDRSDPHIDQMLGLYQKVNLPTDGKIHLAFGLAKAFEDLGDYAEAFGYLQSGNDLRRSEFHYDIESDRSLIRSIIECFSQQALNRLQVSGESSNRPIFILGMPRSGTSLVEKIIASHSEVYGAGELDTLFALGTRHFLGAANNFEYQALDTYSPDIFNEIGKTYLQQLAALNTDAKRVTDKMPFNMMMIGIISVALPNAKIIHCVRDARDTCLSIYKQNFTTGNYRFAYDLKTVAQFYNLYSELMTHWHAALPGRIYDVRYEDLTADPDQEIRKLLSACDLAFEEDCLRFEKTEAVVKTASAAQVRQPMYRSSVALWERYEAFLQPMLDELGAE
ncbi:MAG TPA: sulfotransferase [Woeseiaceae bacterium]|nr:sulfotransferase [Woeseiaceae bacterium]